MNSLVMFRNRRRQLKYLNLIVGYPQPVAYDQERRRPGRQRSVSLRAAAVGRGLDIILSNSIVPLRLAVLLGLLASFLSLLYFLYVLAIAVLKQRVIGDGSRRTPSSHRCSCFCS